jgi:hypothetical protein
MTRTRRTRRLLVALLLLGAGVANAQELAPPPLPLSPVPSQPQAPPSLWLPQNYRVAVVEDPPRLVPRNGMIVAGAVVAGGVWSANLMAAIPTGQWALYVPLFGPLIEMAQIHQNGSDEVIGWVDFLLVSDALAQIGGVALAIAGSASHKKIPGGQHLVIVPTGTGISGQF